jgi:hypothetical protein
VSYLKDPPSGYLYPAVDMEGSLADILSDINNGHYKNDYDLQLDLWNLFQSTHDFHTIYQADLVYAFSYERGGSLISVSPDGVSKPSTYVLSDANALIKSNEVGYEASPVVLINGVDVETWINEYAALNPWDHDPDANCSYLDARTSLRLRQTC